MNLRIFSAEQAASYRPIDQTYVIRIQNSDKFSERDRVPLYRSERYKSIHTYIFDDVSSVGRDTIMLSANLAKRIIIDFKEHGLDCDSLLVHCTKGRNRSPAIALALNEIFHLGADTELIRTHYPDLTEWMYNWMIDSAKIIL